MNLYVSFSLLYFVQEPTISDLANCPTKATELMIIDVALLTRCIGNYAKYLIAGVDSRLISDTNCWSCAAALERVLKLTRAQLLRLRVGTEQCIRDHFDFRMQTSKITLIDLN